MSRENATGVTFVNVMEDGSRLEDLSGKVIPVTPVTKPIFETMANRIINK